MNDDFAVAKGFENLIKNKHPNWINKGKIDGRLADDWTPIYKEFLEYCKDIPKRNKDKRFFTILDRVKAPEDLQALLRELHRRPVKV